MGVNFSAGNGLWLEAITSFAGVQYTPLLTIGNDVNFSDYVHVACTREVHVGDGVLCGSHVVISDHSHGIYSGPEQSSPLIRPNLRPLSKDKSVKVGANVWIGDGAAILGGACVGTGSIIGAHAVVSGPIPDYCIAVGSPARVIRQWNAASGLWEKPAG
jgi:lipopolysaccharide O-acetyltransferase